MPPNQQRQSTEGKLTESLLKVVVIIIIMHSFNVSCVDKCNCSHLDVKNCGKQPALNVLDGGHVDGVHVLVDFHVEPQRRRGRRRTDGVSGEAGQVGHGDLTQVDRGVVEAYSTRQQTGHVVHVPGYTYTHTHTRLMALCPGLPG